MPPRGKATRKRGGKRETKAIEPKVKAQIKRIDQTGSEKNFEVSKNFKCQYNP